MTRTDAGDFRRRQAVADLRHAAKAAPGDAISRIAAGFDDGAGAGPGLARRLGFLFRGQAPLSSISEDARLRAALLLSSGSPDTGQDAFVFSNLLLLLARLEESVPEECLWSAPRLLGRLGLAAASARPALVCGFREARRLGLVSPALVMTETSGLTRSPASVLDGLERAAARGHAPGLMSDLAALVSGRPDPDASGRAWAAHCETTLGLPEPARAAALAAFRHLYERPRSMEPPDGGTLPLIPPAT